MSLPAAVQLVEVSPRDGLQDESGPISTADKAALIEGVVAAGVRRVEVASFVHPDRVPQMADAEAVVAGLSSARASGATLIGLVLNERGAERAIAAGVDEMNAVVVVTDTFSTHNQGVSTTEALAMWARVAALAAGAGTRANVTLAAAFGCPYEGEVEQRRVVELALRVADAGPVEIAVADTIGAAVPTQVGEFVHAVGEATGLPVRVHLHNTRNTGLANVVAALGAGAVALDASLGGVGGCPFAPGATGNLPTEDVAEMLERMGVGTGLDVQALVDLVPWLASVVGHAVPSALARASRFPSSTGARAR